MYKISGLISCVGIIVKFYKDNEFKGIFPSHFVSLQSMAETKEKQEKDYNNMPLTSENSVSSYEYDIINVLKTIIKYLLKSGCNDREKKYTQEYVLKNKGFRFFVSFYSLIIHTIIQTGCNRLETILILPRPTMGSNKISIQAKSGANYLFENLPCYLNVRMKRARGYVKFRVLENDIEFPKDLNQGLEDISEKDIND